MTQTPAIVESFPAVFAQELRPLMRRAYQTLESFTLQTEAYLSLLLFLQPRFPFPPMDAAAIAPDLALLLATQILERRPGLILELGSGVSTLVAGYMVQRNNHGRVVSIEHDAHYLNLARTSVRQHGLTDCVEVIHAPLTSYIEDGRPRLWYSKSFVRNIANHSVDLLFIDGPPAVVENLARLPALPTLIDTLSEDAVILVDDANRAGEREILRQWLLAFPQLHEQRLNTHKGTAVLTFRAPASLESVGAAIVRSK